jgi:hypothetical protein
MKRKVGRPQDPNITSFIERFPMPRRRAAKKIKAIQIRLDACLDDDARRLILGIK